LRNWHTHKSSTPNAKANSLSFLPDLWHAVNEEFPTITAMSELNDLESTEYLAASPASRRAPLQPRSIQTIQRVVDAASSLLSRMPLEDLSTTRIAVEAGISVGALYRFFPDKQTIIDAVAVRHVNRFRSVVEKAVLPKLEQEMTNLSEFQPALVLNLVVDAYVAYLDENPDFRALSFGRHISAATKEREASPAVGLPALLKDFMLARLGIPNNPELDLMLRVVSEAGERLIAFAYEQPTRDERDRILAAMKTMLAGYLFPPSSLETSAVPLSSKKTKAQL
jgi:AcrR family transcriptional regulator